jgi:hypothetical protein
MYNLFVWILLLGYAPSKTSEDEETTPIRREQELLAVRPAREYQASNVSGYRHPPPLSSHSPLGIYFFFSFGLCRFEQHDDL